jgi:hypothetical protein
MDRSLYSGDISQDAQQQDMFPGGCDALVRSINDRVGSTGWKILRVTLTGFSRETLCTSTVDKRQKSRNPNHLFEHKKPAAQ